MNVSLGAEERALQHRKCARTFVDRMRSSAQFSQRQINCEARALTPATYRTAVAGCELPLTPPLCEISKEYGVYRELERAMRVEISKSPASHARTGEPNCNMYPLLS